MEMQHVFYGLWFIAGFMLAWWLRGKQGQQCRHIWRPNGYEIAGPLVGSKIAERCQRCGEVRLIDDSRKEIAETQSRPVPMKRSDPLVESIIDALLRNPSICLEFRVKESSRSIQVAATALSWRNELNIGLREIDATRDQSILFESAISKCINGVQDQLRECKRNA